MTFPLARLGHLSHSNKKNQADVPHQTAGVVSSKNKQLNSNLNGNRNLNKSAGLKRLSFFAHFG